MDKVYKDFTPLKEPLTPTQVEDCEGVDVVVTVMLGDLIGCSSIDGLNEIMDEQVLRPEVNACLADIYYTVWGSITGDPGIGVGGRVHIRVQAQIERF